MSSTFELEPVGFVRGGRTGLEDDHWGAATARIELVPQLSADALRGLADFSHCEVIFLFDQVQPGRIETGARHPRNNPDWPRVGIFAQRGKNRPNRLGITVCRILAVEGTVLEVAELDAVAGTPVLDIKPVMREFLPRQAVRQPEWASQLMSRYWENPAPGRS
jgi:tRNA (adenine37-N6)-methyltransferase